jgi:outer membrane protein assembly factor BamE (lipoprotein component of BamABCDE complex)
MGDNDTKNDAKRICFLEAKRLAIEKAGTYIESSTEIKNFQLTRDEIRTYSGAIIKVDIASEEIRFVGESTVIFMTVKADVDVDSFKEKVRQIKMDKELEKKVREQQSQLQVMEDKIKNLQGQLTTKDFDETIKVRKERKETFERIDELEKIKYAITSKTKTAIEKLQTGMTTEEVIKIAGSPRGQSKCTTDLYLSYGKIWVWLESGVVKGYIPMDMWKGPCASPTYSRIYKRFD